MRMRFMIAGCTLAAVACSALPTETTLRPRGPMFDEAPAETPPAEEAPPEVKDAGCPPGFVVVGIKGTKDGPTVDHNGDGLGCLFVTPSGYEVVVDNGAIAGHHGVCPNGFSIAGVWSVEMAEKDRNHNGAVCQKVTPSGNLVLVDDDYDAPTK